MMPAVTPGMRLFVRLLPPDTPRQTGNCQVLLSSSSFMPARGAAVTSAHPSSACPQEEEDSLPRQVGERGQPVRGEHSREGEALQQRGVHHLGVREEGITPHTAERQQAACMQENA